MRILAVKHMKMWPCNFHTIISSLRFIIAFYLLITIIITITITIAIIIIASINNIRGVIVMLIPK